MKLSGASQANLTNNAAFDGDGAFSPDGKRVLFDSDRDTGDGTLEVYSMKATGANPTRLTTSPGPDFFPDWQAV